MDRREAPIFFAQLLKMGKATGEIPDEERMEIYFEDLMEFPLKHVLEAMTWARKNLSHFPKIPDLKGYIEGDPEHRSNQAWKALINLLRVGPTNTVILTDPVMAKTLEDLWGNWPGVCQAFMKIEGEIAHAVERKTFKAAYMDNWKHRDSRRGPVTMVGFVPEGMYPAELCEYVVQDYRVQLLSRRPFLPIGSEAKGVPMPAEMQQRFQHLLKQIGKRQSSCTAYGSARGPGSA
jgi:hypothetical protein